MIFNTSMRQSFGSGPVTSIMGRNSPGGVGGVLPISILRAFSSEKFSYSKTRSV